MSAPFLYAVAFLMIVACAFSTSAALTRPVMTPPASVLCRISGETILRTTGKPIFFASVAACFADVANPSFGLGMAYASQTILPSGAVSEVRPSAFTLSSTARTFFMSFAIAFFSSWGGARGPLPPPCPPAQRGQPACHEIFCQNRAPVQRDGPPKTPGSAPWLDLPGRAGPDRQGTGAVRRDQAPDPRRRRRGFYALR